MNTYNDHTAVFQLQYLDQRFEVSLYFTISSMDGVVYSLFFYTVAKRDSVGECICSEVTTFVL